MAIIDQTLSALRRSSVLTRILGVNIAVFVALRLTAIVGVFSDMPGLIDTVDSWLELPADIHLLAMRPWTVITYMFTQWDLTHVVFNMLWLYWFGTIFLTISSPARLLLLYLGGGLCGALFYVAGYSLLPAGIFATGSSLIGSSASVLAIVTAVAILMPRFRMMLFLLGSVEIRWIALATIVLVLIGVTGRNAGGELAHLGGITAGLVYALSLRRGLDLIAPLLRLPSRLKSLFSRRPGPKSAKASPEPPHTTATPGGLSPQEREELDLILDKIKKSGYTSLTHSERDRLFSVSSRIK